MQQPTLMQRAPRDRPRILADKTSRAGAGSPVRESGT